VRGLLCHGCNAALGFMRDDHTRTSAATEYLLKLKRDDETK
jgi:recombination endonuclease VII